MAVLLPAACSNFHAVEEGRVYRSAQPTEPEMTRWIWRHGIETVVRLRGGGPGNAEFDASHRPTVTAGVDFVQLPLSARRFPEKAELVGLCEIFEHARYPLLLHCKAGADRSGLASAVYVLHRWGDLSRARQQLSLDYLHLSWFSAGKLDTVLDMYEPWQARMSFCQWALEVYERPSNDELPEGYLDRQRELAVGASAESGR